MNDHQSSVQYGRSRIALKRVIEQHRLAIEMGNAIRVLPRPKPVVERGARGSVLSTERSSLTFPSNGGPRTSLRPRRFRHARTSLAQKITPLESAVRLPGIAGSFFYPLPSVRLSVHSKRICLHVARATVSAQGARSHDRLAAPGVTFLFSAEWGLLHGGIFVTRCNASPIHFLGCHTVASGTRSRPSPTSPSICSPRRVSIVHAAHPRLEARQ